MTKIVISECADAYTGARYQPGQRVPDTMGHAQVQRLVRAGCVLDLDLSALTPAERASLAARGVDLALAEAAEEAVTDAGRLAHGEAVADLEADVARRREELAVLLADEDATARATLLARREADEAEARRTMTARLAEEEAAARTEMEARLAESIRAADAAAGATAPDNPVEPPENTSPRAASTQAGGKAHK